MKTSLAVPVVTTFLLLTVTGCVQSRPSSLTPGAAKMYIRPGETHQAKIIEIFGTPNIVTHRDGGEMWVYDKVSSRLTQGAFGFGGLGGGGGSGGFGGGGLGGGYGSSTRSETTVMLIVYYDERDIVRDYKITQTKF